MFAVGASPQTPAALGRAPVPSPDRPEEAEDARAPDRSSAPPPQADFTPSRPSPVAAQTAFDARAADESEPETPAETNPETDANGLTEEERKVVDELRARDAEVRRHEQAHKAVAGQYAGAISYTFQQGPDGKRYAIGGEVPIDVSAIPGDPEATIAKMQVVIRAALAPAEPSAADRAIARAAQAQLAQAQADARAQRQAESLGAEKNEPVSRVDRIAEEDAVRIAAEAAAGYARAAGEAAPTPSGTLLDQAA